MKPIRNLDDLALENRTIGPRKLCYRISAPPPGKAAWPFHSHLLNE